MKKTFFYYSQGYLRPLCVVLMQALSGIAWGATTDIADTPVLGGIGVATKPNIMLLMDTSNSMSWTHMPDQLEVEGTKQSIGYKSSQCNSLYYNPAQTYRRPKDASDALLPTPNFTAAAYNYYVDSITTVNLSDSFQAHDANTVRSVVLSVADAKQSAYYYVYSGSATLAYNTSPCNMMDTAAPNTVATISATGGSWTRKLVSSTSGVAGRPDERENFAIWYTFYRTRMNLAKSAIGLAFAPLSNNYRVGFLNGNPTIVGTGSSITPSNMVQPSRYQKIADFDSTQKINWFSKLYGQYPAGSSPTREALARVGRHYAGKIDGINQGMPEDPLQQACQSNFTILTTDGYWNTEAEKTGLGGGPTNISGNGSVGQQDSPWTPDTGLVPYGVYDFTANGIAYTDTSTTTSRYSYDSCSRNVSGQYTRQVLKSKNHWKKVVTTAARPNSTVTQKKTSQVAKRTWTVKKSTLQWRTKATVVNKSTSQSLWYNPATEQTSPVASCSGLTSCTVNNTGPTADASCVAQTATNANGFLTVLCTTAVQDTAVPSCSGADCYPVATGPTAVAGNACANSLPNSGNQYITTTCAISDDKTVFNNGACSNTYAAGGNQTCSTVPASPSWQAVASCSASNGSSPDWIKTECQTVSSCVPNGGNTCAATSTTTYGGKCVAVPGTTCSLVEKTPPKAVSANSCKPSASQTTPTEDDDDDDDDENDNWTITKCTIVETPPVEGSCNPRPANNNNNWVQTLCTGSVAVPGHQKRKTDTILKTRTYGSGLVVGPTSSSSWELIGGCIDPATEPALPADLTVTHPPIVVSASQTGGSTNSLADVAQYYYKTDLRPSMPDLVRPAGTDWNDDKASWQHMTTFVVGLGVSGTKKYREDYLTATTGDFANIRAGTGSWPLWPDPATPYASNAQLYNDPKSIDDFWHTAVNGRGKYFSANNPETIVSGIRGALSAIDISLGAGSSAAISDLTGITIDGLNYMSSYTTGRWVGDIQARPSEKGSTQFWSARAKLDTQTQLACDDRNIYIRKAGASNNLGKFTSNTTKCSDGSVSSDLSSDVLSKLSIASLSQYPDFTNGTMATANQVSQATVSSLVNYLRGQRQNEGFVSGASGKLYRQRDSVMGDIINSKPQYVGAPNRDYRDIGYASFKSVQAARQGMLYVGGNDGMLHAIYAPPVTATGAALANAGKEAWAYIPTEVIPKLSMLAGNNYANNHHFFVDGTPVIGDVSKQGTWRTILVGGLNAGGKSFYALDITNPSTPISLWEFDSTSCNECDVGLSFGKPVIGKLKDGTWVVLLTSGYNNATGKGILFVLDAITGKLIRAVNTETGSASSPSGLAQISAWTARAGINDTVERVYGGDVLGNVWRFDINDVIAPPGYDAKLIGTAKDSSGTPQSITTAPELGAFNNRPFVYVGTGRILGFSDLNSSQVQTVYGIWDNLNSNTGVGNLRNALKPNITNASTYTFQCTGTTAVCAAENPNGWYVDLAGSKEQINLPLTLVGSTLVIVTNQPQADACLTGGTSRVYFAEGNIGKPAGTGLRLGDKGVAGVTIVNNYGTPPSASSAGTSDSVKGYARDVEGTAISPFTIPVSPPPAGGKRVSWRELVQP